MGRMDESEQEYLTAVKLGPSADTWGALARSYLKRDRSQDAVDAMEQEARFAPRPYLIWQDLGTWHLEMNQPEDAARVLDKAARSTPSALRKADNGFFDSKVAQGQAAAYEALGNHERAIAYQEKAANLQPNVPAPWRRLAQMYTNAGRTKMRNAPESTPPRRRKLTNEGGIYTFSCVTIYTEEAWQQTWL